MVIEVRRTSAGEDPEAVGQALDIRYEVFVDEQGVPVELERDADDASCEHFLAVADGVLIGAGRLVVEVVEATEPVEPAEPGGPARLRGHLGRLAVLAKHRGTGAGVALVRAIEDRAGELGLAEVYLGAQLYATGFYARLGYEPYGAQFWDAGIKHIHMRKRLTLP